MDRAPMDIQFTPGTLCITAVLTILAIYLITRKRD